MTDVAEIPRADAPSRPLTATDDLPRPRFLAVSEFGPGNFIYHEGSRYVINRVLLPVSDVSDPTNGRTVNTTTATQTVTIRGGIYATQSASVLDRSILRLPNGAAATLINSGTGTTQIANDAHTGDILSRGPVSPPVWAVLSVKPPKTGTPLNSTGHPSGTTI